MRTRAGLAVAAVLTLSAMSAMSASAQESPARTPPTVSFANAADALWYGRERTYTEFSEYTECTERERTQDGRQTRKASTV